MHDFIHRFPTLQHHQTKIGSLPFPLFQYNVVLGSLKSFSFNWAIELMMLTQILVRLTLLNSPYCEELISLFDTMILDVLLVPLA